MSGSTVEAGRVEADRIDPRPLDRVVGNRTVVRDRDAAGEHPRLQAVRDGLLVGVPLSGSVALARAYAHNGVLGSDYRANAWTAGRALFHGMHVYVLPSSPAVRHFTLFDWGPASAVLLAPLALLPSRIASPIVAGLCVVAILLTLSVCGVRDWRVYCIVMTWPFVAIGWLFGNVELLLALALAIAWRYRDRPKVAGLLIAAMLSIKIIMWPVLIWLLATRRYAAAIYALGWAVVINLIAWATVGFGEIPRYVNLLPAVARIARPLGSGVISLAVHIGASPAAADVVALVLATVIAIGCVLAGRRGEELLAFALAIVVCLIATPIVDSYYYTLLVVPLALARPRFGRIWGIPLVLWLALIVLGQWGQIGTTLVCLAMTAALGALSFPREILRSALPARPGCPPDRSGDPLEALASQTMAILQRRRSS